MTILDDLRKLSSAEEFFDVLGVDYDPAVIRVARLHI
ncbi:MAG: nitrogenase-stabilizing/protective protein NifW, partial [Methylocystis sp.]